MQCVQTKRKLDQKGAPYETADLKDPVNREAAKSLGHMSAPLVVVGDEPWSGFRPDLINRIAERTKVNE